MPNYRGLRPRLRWGVGLVNVVEFDGFDNAVAYSEPIDGSEYALAPSGAEDAWIPRVEYFLEGDMRWIPRDDVTSPRRATGWNGVIGVDAMLQWMRQKNIARYHPDSRNIVVSPLMNLDTSGDGVVDDFSDVPDGCAVTYTRDVTDLAQKLNVTANATGLAKNPRVIQDVYGISVGETLTLACDGRFTGATGGAISYLAIAAHDAGGAQIGGGAASPNFASSPAVYTRQSVAYVVPAGAVKVRVHATSSVPNGSVLQAFFRNMALLRDGTTLFIDNPAYSAILGEPMKGAPGLERVNHRRTMRLKLRNALGVAFDGY